MTDGNDRIAVGNRPWLTPSKIVMWLCLIVQFIVIDKAMMYTDGPHIQNIIRGLLIDGMFNGSTILIVIAYSFIPSVKRWSTLRAAVLTAFYLPFVPIMITSLIALSKPYEPVIMPTYFWVWMFSLISHLPVGIVSAIVIGAVKFVVKKYPEMKKRHPPSGKAFLPDYHPWIAIMQTAIRGDRVPLIPVKLQNTGR